MATISVRVDDELKDSVERVFAGIGLSAAAATSVFYHQVVNYGRIPFELISTPSDTEYLSSIPHMEKSIVDGMKVPASKLHSESELPW
ncbi:MAG: type II toxin-antitoxin system RelB/DinJ family antitoxin [Candidatus Ancillula sp.]|jgi:addiction module RelB/DinJ family antitoxin|nr:type II toxin-antitoxin system RelB/DinJ family antitoxin [Candidatus Ancillula sp.]